MSMLPHIEEAFHNFVLDTLEGLNILAMDEVHGKNETSIWFWRDFWPRFQKSWQSPNIQYKK